MLPGTGADGIAIENDLLAAGLPVEAAERDTIVAQVSLADTAASIGRLTDALIASVARHRGKSRPVVSGAAYQIAPVTVMPPRAAFFAPSHTVALHDAVGRVSVELVAPYPPGIPILAPGEEVTGEVLDGLSKARSDDANRLRRGPLAENTARRCVMVALSQAGQAVSASWPGSTSTAVRNIDR